MKHVIFSSLTHISSHPIWVTCCGYGITNLKSHLMNMDFIFKKFTLEELVDMPACNLLETVHNIWLQQLGKRGVCLYITTSDDYV